MRRGMISNTGLDGARDIIGRLRTNDLLPPCLPIGLSGQNGTSSQGGTEAHPVEAPSTAATEPGAAATPTTTATPLPAKTPEPGVSCRKVS